MEPCAAAQQLVPHVFPVQLVHASTHGFASYLTHVAFWQGSGRERLQNKMQIHVHNSITVCNQLNSVSYIEQGRV